ncbi:MAG: hypothetical protein R3F50_02070 [Gammaproteobacteria bacterium]
MFNNSRAQRKGLLIATLAAALLTALVGYWLMHRLQTDSVQSIQQSIDTWRLTLTLGRWTVIALVAFGWNASVEYFAKTGKINFAQTGQLQWFRWRAVTWLVILELVLGQGMVVKFFSMIPGSIF